MRCEKRLMMGDVPALVNPGWTARTWIMRLRYLADCCEEDHPERAEELRAWAEKVETHEGYAEQASRMSS